MKILLRMSKLKFIFNKLKQNNELILIGQNRIVTNGSKFSYLNNQPLITENIVGIHNGIFTNLDHSCQIRQLITRAFYFKMTLLIFLRNYQKLQILKILLKNISNI